jgi:hypothetical protein
MKRKFDEKEEYSSLVAATKASGLSPSAFRFHESQETAEKFQILQKA